MYKARNILLIGKDPALFGAQAGLGDSRERHMRYAQLWREKGNPQGEIKIICYTNRDDHFQKEQLGDGLELIPTRSRCRSLFVKDAWKQISKLKRSGWYPDLISPQTPWEEGNLAARMAKRLDARLLPQLHFDLFSRAWLKEHWSNPLRYRLGCAVLKRADGVRVVSEALRKKVVSQLGLDPEKVIVAPVPVSIQTREDYSDKAKYKQRLGLAEGPMVLFVGRFCATKNLSLWLRVASELAGRHSAVQFVLVGEGELMAKTQLAALHAGIEHRVFFTGKIEYDRLPDYFAAADVFLLSSSHEGYGRVVVEAGFSGVPTVSTRTAGPEDLIEENDTGLLLECGDEQGLVDAVRDLVQDASLRRAMGQRAWAKMRREQSPEVLEERLIQSWRSVLSA